MAKPEQMSDFFEGCLAGQLVDVVAAINEFALFAEDVTERGGRRHHAFQALRFRKGDVCDRFGRLGHCSATFVLPSPETGEGAVWEVGVYEGRCGGGMGWLCALRRLPHGKRSFDSAQDYGRDEGCLRQVPPPRPSPVRGGGSKRRVSFSAVR